MNRILSFSCLSLWLLCACGKNESRYPIEIRFIPLDSDTIYINERYNKYLSYDNESFDKRMNSVDKHSSIKREIILYYLADTKVRDENYIKNSNLKDSLIVTSYNEIDLRSIHFIKSGDYYLSGFIEDKLIDSTGKVLEQVNSLINQKITVVEREQ